MLRIISLFLGACLLSACAYGGSASLKPIPPDKPAPGDATKDPVLYHQFYGDTDEGRERVIEALKTNLADARKKNAAGAILSAQTSLLSLGASSESDVDAANIELTKALIAKKEPGAALAMPGHVIPMKAINAEDLELFMRTAYDNASLEPLKRAVNESKRRGVAVPEAYLALLKKNFSQSERIKGTVTVWVDHGYKVKYGMASPDFVLGSGFFIDKEGYILTNYHVVASEVDPEYSGFSRLYVQLWNANGDRIPARVIGYSKISDIALIKADVTPEFVHSFAITDTVDVGQKVYALGSPGGLESTLTTGIVSNIDRRLLPIGDVVQIDASVNPGNSGGPLINDDGGVIGVVFAGLPQFQGVNFALPASLISSILPKLAEKGSVKLGYLGITVFDWADGCEATYVETDSPLDRAGLKPGDFITTINGKAVKKMAAAQKELAALPANTLIRVSWRSGTAVKSAVVPFFVRPDLPIKRALAQDTEEKLFPPLFGLSVTKMDNKNFVVKKIYPGTSAAIMGLNPGDILTFLGRVKTPPEAAIFAIRLRTKLRKSGYLEGVVVMGAPLAGGDWL